ncbi:MAG: site-specific integrase, partial [Candidatus Neptunochlamydia sp.]|nr:site-specific integrase [Candidatus Neptunochlamydia sp.]
MNIPQGIDRRVAKNGKVSYSVCIRIKGHQSFSKTFKNLTHAKQWKRITESSVEKGEYVHHSVGKEKTLSDTIEKYLIEVLFHKPKDAKNINRHLLRWKEELGFSILSKIKSEDLSKIRDKLLTETTSRRKERSPSTVVCYISSLSHLFSVAINENGGLDQRKSREIHEKTKKRSRANPLLTKRRSKNLLQECKNSRSSYLFTIVLIALQTGMRQGEILSLKWEDIDFENQWIYLKQTKNDTPRTVPITQDILNLLKYSIEKISPLVFPSPMNIEKPIDIRKAWVTALKRAKIENFLFHDFRHTTAS